MSRLIHRAPSVGGLVKKIMEINPELGVREISQIIRQSTHAQGSEAGDYAALEIVDEAKAIELAQSTLR
ncbi:MAG: hypothetical protein ACJ763_10655 [Bdellovibrionia bacterium]